VSAGLSLPDGGERVTVLARLAPWFFLGTCFTVSGATGLVLQVVWARQLTDIFGSSSLAIATVLATFMAGLALGAHVGGRLADRLAVAEAGPSGAAGAVPDAVPGSRWRSPLMGYAVAEAVVGLSALLIPLLFAAYRSLGPALWSAMPDQPIVLALVRLGLTAVALLLPTTAMGATLPLLGRHVTRRRGEVRAIGRRVGALYATNTAGALLGAAAAGFWLIQTIGLAATSHVAAAVALGVAAVVALAVARTRAGVPEADTDPQSEQSEQSDSPGTAAPAATLVLVAYALSGAVAMGLEVFFSRALAIVLGSSVYSFTLVLVVFLFGLSAGAALAARSAARTAHPVAALAALFLALAAAILLSHALIDWLPWLLLALLEATHLGIGAILTIHALIAGLVILPIALGLGAVMPLVMRATVGDLDRLGRDVGRAYAANTVGAIAGALAAGFVALPWLGLDGGLRLAVVIEAGLGVALAWRATRRPRMRAGAAAAAAVACALALFAPGWDQSDFTAGLFRGHLVEQAIAQGGPSRREVLFYRDGVSTTVSVERVGRSLVLKNNGKVEASDRHDMPTQILVGLLPVVLHPGREQEVFVIGYGSGVTVGAITQADSVSRIDVAELEPAVLEAADRFFAELSHRPAADPRVHRLLGDGRSVLLASGRRYDVIVSEPSNPWIAGVASLFTADFYRAARSRLAPGGVFCQWAQLYELGPARVKMIYRTFASAFPHVYAFTPGDETTDTILIGSDTPIRMDLTALARLMRSSPKLAAELARADIDAPAELAASLLLGAGEIAAFTAGAELNTDDNTSLEHGAPRDLFSSVRGNRFARSVRGATWPYGRLDQLVTGLGSGPALATAELDLARALLAYGRRREAATWIDRAAVHAEASASTRLERLHHLTGAVDFADPELVVTAGSAGPLPSPSPDLFAGGDEAGRREAARELTEAYRLVAGGRWHAAWQAFARLPDRTGDDRGRDIDLIAAYAAYKALDLEPARDLLSPLYGDESYSARRPAVSYYMGRASYGVGAFRDGTRALARFVDRHPDLVDEVLSRRLPSSQ
jgi:spermidine synthase